MPNSLNLAKRIFDRRALVCLLGIGFLLSGCSAPSVPQIPKDVCAKTGKNILDEEKVVNALVYAYRLEGFTDLAKEHYANNNYEFRQFIEKNTVSDSSADVRESAKSYYRHRPDCCKLLEPWAIRDIRRERESRGRFKLITADSMASIYWHEYSPTYEWVNDVNIKVFENKNNSVREIVIEVGNCGETRFRDRG